MATWTLTAAGVVVAAYCSVEAISAVVGNNWGLETPRAVRLTRPLLFAEFLIVGLMLFVIDPNFRNSPGTVWIIAACPVTAAIFAPRMVMVTPKGLRRARFLRKDIFILWEDLDHYEIYRGTFGVADVYHIRTKDGRSIKINDVSQDGNALIRSIGNYKNLPRLPFPY